MELNMFLLLEKLHCKMPLRISQTINHQLIYNILNCQQVAKDYELVFGGDSKALFVHL